MQTEHRSSIHLIHEDECEALLRAHGWGRLGVQVRDHPEIFPVNYTMDGHRIVFRVDRGTKLASIRQHHIISFQIDAVDEDERSGWSVEAVGPVSEVFDAADIERLESLGLESWAVGETTHWLRLSPHRLSGRRLVPVDRPVVDLRDSRSGIDR